MKHWDLLEKELDLWRQAGLVLPLWWRDDDAVAATPALERLSALAEHIGLPVYLAVIPSELEPSLPLFVADNDSLKPVTHGYAHKNYSSAGEKKCEFGNGREAKVVSGEISAGYEALKAAFGARFVPMFVPPWNRFSKTHINALQEVGYKGFSTFTPRKEKWAAPGLEYVNTHVDPIDWHGSRSLAAPEAILAHAVSSLRDRRLGGSDNSEPFGLLTHHLVLDAEIWAFCEEFLERMMAGPTRVWTAKNLGKEV